MAEINSETDFLDLEKSAMVEPKRYGRVVKRKIVDLVLCVTTIAMWKKQVQLILSKIFT